MTTTVPRHTEACEAHGSAEAANFIEQAFLFDSSRRIGFGARVILTEPAAPENPAAAKCIDKRYDLYDTTRAFVETGEPMLLAKTGDDGRKHFRRISFE